MSFSTESVPRTDGESDLNPGFTFPSATICMSVTKQDWTAIVTKEEKGLKA